MMNFIVRSLTPALLGDFLDYFDREAFVDNPHWASCYCQFYLTDHRNVDWDRLSGAENRHSAIERIHAGEMQGYLAYHDEKVVGWCNAAPRRLYPALIYDDDLALSPDEATGSIVCFIVAPAFRQQGVATALLESACQGLAQAGLLWAEGYPRVNTDNPASNYHGPLQMYQEAGFEMVREYTNFQIVRRALVSQDEE